MMRGADILFIGILWGTAHGVSNQNVDLHCTDFQGRPVKQSAEFVPKENDPCMTCTCEDGFPVMCTSVLCSPPDCKFWEAIEGECCRFNCIETPDVAPDGNNATGGVNTKPNAADTTNLGLRLVASTVTSLLILALLLFMIHRLRQRRTLISMRRLNAENQEEDAVAYMTQIDQVDIGIEFPPYEDPPPPYSPPKPQHIPHGEAPPPYEEQPGGENEGNNNNGPNPDATVTGVNGVRPSQGQGSIQVGNEQARNGTVSRQNQRNNELSQVNGHCVNGDASQTNEEDGGSEPRQTIMARGRVIETLLRNASSSRTSSLSRTPGNKKDRKCTNKRAGENYGLSIALASLGGASGTTEASPSRVMVSMQNNNPQSSLVRFNEEPGTSHSDMSAQDTQGQNVDEDGARWDAIIPGKHNSLPGRNNPKNCPEKWTQFIKKSDSIEIKHGSNSPRNSFLLEDKHFQPDYQSTCLTESQQVCGNSANSASPSPGTSLSLLGAATCHIAETADTSDKDQIKNSQSQGRRRDDTMSKSTSYAEPGSANCMTESRMSLPPMILDLPIREASRNSRLKPEDQKSEIVGKPCEQNNHLWKQNCEPVHSVYSAAPESVIGSTQSPSITCQSLQSPMPNSSTTRSQSLESNISIFSVCSETGERKSSAAAAPFTIRNDVQYPHPPFTSLYSAPLTSPINPSAERSLHKPKVLPSVDFRCELGESNDHKKESQSCNLPSGSNGCSGANEATSSKYSPTNVPGQQGNDSHSNGSSRGNGRKVIYMEPDEMCENSSSQDSGEQSNKYTSGSKNANNSSKSRKDSHKDRVKKNVAATSGSAQSGVPPTDSKEKNTMRKTKQKKHNSVIKFGMPEETPASKGDGQAGHNIVSNNSQSAASFKQYGFIDDPEVLKSCCEGNIYPSTGDQIPAKSLVEKVRQRSHSRERRRSRDNSKERNNSHQRHGSEERGKKSRESSKSPSHSRDRSRSRGKQSPNAERNRKRRSRHTDTVDGADIPSDVAVVNGDLNSIPNRRAHMSRSPNRRHKKYCSSTPAVDNADPRLDDQRNANAASNMETANSVYDKTNSLLNSEPVSNYISMTEGNTTHGSSHSNQRLNRVSNPYLGCNNLQTDQSETVNQIQANHSIVINR